MIEALKIYKDTDPELRVVCKDVVEFNKELADTAATMYATMIVNGGCGLAANQVGLDIRLICVKGSQFSGCMVNPRWTAVAKDGSKFGKEGCLSIPKKSVRKSRFNTITVNFFLVDGEERTIVLKDLDAVIVQHECDHLNGILMTDEEYDG